MKVAFIIPRNDDQHQPVNPTNQCRILPPVGLAHMAGVMGKLGSVTLHDERINSDNPHQRVQIAIVFINHYNQQRACDIARHYRLSGSFVILTGPKLSGLSDLPTRSANCLFIGPGEDYIAKFLTDYQTGKPKRIYRNHTQFAIPERDKYSKTGSKLKLAS